MLERILLLFEKYPLSFISDLSSILPIIVGLVNYRYLTRNLKIIMLFFCMYLIGDIYMIYLAALRQNNLFILNLYPIGGILFLTIAYITIFKQDTIRKVIGILAGLSLSICLIFFKPLEISPIELFAYRLYIMVLSLLYFNKIISDMMIKNILVHSLFWVNSGIIIYAAGTFFISIFSEVIFDPNLVDDETFDLYWNINNVLFILLVFLSSVGIWFSKYERENFSDY